MQPNIFYCGKTHELPGREETVHVLVQNIILKRKLPKTQDVVITPIIDF